jgi:glucose-1-phosphate adenylyltransferase
MYRNKLIGLINLSESDYYIKQLTYNRPIASIPFLGRYRIIDFALSNLMNAGVDTVGIFLNDKYRSLMDHIKSGAEWDLDRKNGGIFYFSPYSNAETMTQLRGDIHNYFSNLDFLTEAHGEYVIITGSSMVCNIDYQDVLKQHLETKADVTVVYREVSQSNTHFDRCSTVTLNEYENVVAVGKNIKRKEVTEKDRKKISMEMYLVKKELLVDLITDAVATGENVYLTDVLHYASAKYKVKGYKFTGLVRCINSTENYYKASMDMLDENNIVDLFFQDRVILTKVKDEVPSYYHPDSVVENSLIANGCKIEGTVRNSVLFRRVNVAKGAVVENSIIMQNGDIRENSSLNCVITDKQVIITEGTELKGDPKNPVVVDKGTIL